MRKTFNRKDELELELTEHFVNGTPLLTGKEMAEKYDIAISYYSKIKADVKAALESNAVSPEDLAAKSVNRYDELEAKHKRLQEAIRRLNDDSVLEQIKKNIKQILTEEMEAEKQEALAKIEAEAQKQRDQLEHSLRETRNDAFNEYDL